MTSPEPPPEDYEPRHASDKVKDHTDYTGKNRKPGSRWWPWARDNGKEGKENGSPVA